MPKIRNLDLPPIKEAIITVSFNSSITADLQKKFCEHDFIKKSYPVQKGILNFNITARQTTPNKKLSATTNHTHEGYLLECGVNCNRSIQLKLGSLSFHNTNEYIGWETFFSEFKQIWSVLCEASGKVDLVQMGVRYINQISIDLPLKDGLKGVTNLLPNIPEGINPNVNSFFLQINTPGADNTMNGIINETILPAVKNNQRILLLDITATKNGNFPCNSEEMWASLNSIRNFKNDIFFNCLTEQQIKKYEHDNTKSSG